MRIGDDRDGGRAVGRIILACPAERVESPRDFSVNQGKVLPGGNLSFKGQTSSDRHTQ